MLPRLRLEYLNSLNEDEQALLWTIINYTGKKPIANVDMELSTFVALPAEIVNAKIIAAEKLIVAEKQPILHSLKNKLGII